MGNGYSFCELGQNFNFPVQKGHTMARFLRGRNCYTK